MASINESRVTGSGARAGCARVRAFTGGNVRWPAIFFGVLALS